MLYDHDCPCMLHVLSQVSLIYASVLHIEYQPSRLRPLPRSMCVEDQCMVPHYDIQGHSASVEWLFTPKSTVHVHVRDDSWTIHPVNNTLCYILLSESADNDDDEEDDFDSPCIWVLKNTEPSIFDGIFFKEFIIEWIPQVALFIVTVIAVHVVMGLLARRKGRVTGLVRVSFVNPKIPTKHYQLPCKDFKDLEPDAVIKQLLEKPGYSSFTVIKTRYNYLEYSEIRTVESK